MSRLYYPQDQAGVLAGAGDDNNGIDVGEAAKKVAKLIPTEIVTAYAALVSASAAIRFEAWRNPAVWICFAICLVLTPFYLNHVADAARPKRNQIIVGTLAFPVWAYLISGAQVVPGYYDAGVATIAALIFSLVTSLIPMDR